MDLISTNEIEKDGIVYIQNIYSDGKTNFTEEKIKFEKSNEIISSVPQPTNTELAELLTETQSNQLIIFEVLATLYDEIAALSTTTGV